VALGNEPVKDDGRVVGRVSSGGLGYSLGLSIAYAWVPAERVQAGTRLSVEVFGETVGAEVRGHLGIGRIGVRVCLSMHR
jgi:4-methylaminobutanoate oxidase (formaldehyde-forming)